MELSAHTIRSAGSGSRPQVHPGDLPAGALGSTSGIELAGDPTCVPVRDTTRDLVRDMALDLAVEVVDRAVDLTTGPDRQSAEEVVADEVAADGEPGPDTESVVVHVQLRPRRPAVRKCLAALTALAAAHPSVAFELTGLSKDDRVVRVTVGVDLGPRAEVAKFSPTAQAAYLFVDGLFTSLYDFMPVYVPEPAAVERVAAVGVLDAVALPRPFIPAPRRGEAPVPPADAPLPADQHVASALA